MWEYEHAVETTSVSAEAVWRRWTDVTTWAEWNADIEKVELDGPFEAGGTITMTPVGDDPVVLRIAEVRENELFVDEAELGDVVVRTMHRVEQLDTDRIRIEYRTEITGPGADQAGPEIGPAITGDFPETMAALVRAAAG
jgi:hypothetical protein